MQVLVFLLRVGSPGGLIGCEIRRSSSQIHNFLYFTSCETALKVLQWCLSTRRFHGARRRLQTLSQYIHTRRSATALLSLPRAVSPALSIRDKEFARRASGNRRCSAGTAAY